MFYYLHQLWWLYTPLNLFKYVTVRAVAGAGTAFLICLILGPRIVSWLAHLKMGEIVRKDEAPLLYERHGKKEGTPTMGGLLIILAVFTSSVLWAMPTSPLVWLVLATMCYMGLVGFLDDYAKISKVRSKGLKGRMKLLLQGIWVLVLGFSLLQIPGVCDRFKQLMVPFIKYPLMADMGPWLAILFMGVVVIGATNAVNLTDGLDGLAIGCSSSVAFSYLVMAYVSGHIHFAEYLRIPYVPDGGELAVVCGCVLGASLGFLWWNCHPAGVFMGDTGSLALGGAIAAIAVLIKQELALVIVGGVFVIEALSVILQVLSFRITGKRIFRMAPLHHHFEMKNWTETQVTVRFWIISIIFALLGLLTLKIR